MRNVYRVIKFNKKSRLKPQIYINTELRKKAKNDFEKTFIRFMRNVDFGGNHWKFSKIWGHYIWLIYFNLAKFLTVMVSCSRFIGITNSSDHRKVWTANLLHTKYPNLLHYDSSSWSMLIYFNFKFTYSPLGKDLILKEKERNVQ